MRRCVLMQEDEPFEMAELEAAYDHAAQRLTAVSVRRNSDRRHAEPKRKRGAA